MAYALRVIVLSVFAGFLLSTFWSSDLVDNGIADNVANPILGYEADGAELTGTVAGAFYAFVTGLAGTFTACNICAFSAIAPLAGEKRTVGKVLQPLLYLALGMIVVAGLYGAIGTVLGDGHLQLNQTRLGDPETGIRVRSLQTMAVFVSIGLVYIAWGLNSLGVIRNPFANFSARYPWARPAFMGATIGVFLIGRPFGLFRNMFAWAAETHNPAIGASAFVLQAAGNVLLMVGVFLFLVYGTGGRFERWLHAKSGRIQTVTAVALIVGGTFFVLYWGPRVLARNDLFVWPYFDWETYRILFSRPPAT